jgi:hypothetical protein
MAADDQVHSGGHDPKGVAASRSVTSAAPWLLAAGCLLKKVAYLPWNELLLSDS